MYIKQLKIDAFGRLREREITFSPGLNIIEGENESGKSAVAMFIKFMLYGLSSKSAGGELSERKLYVNWDTGLAAGSMTLADEGQEYRIERTLQVSSGNSQKETARESVRIIDTAANTQVFRGKIPGEALFGVTEAIFMNTVFIRQIDGTRPSGTSILASIENLLFTADENISTKKAVDRLDNARKQILYKNAAGGLLYERRNERSDAVAALQRVQEQNRALADTEEEYDRAVAVCASLREKIARQTRVCECGQINLTKRRFDAAAATRKKLELRQEELKEKEADGVDRTYLREMTECDNRLAGQTETLNKLREARGILHHRLSDAEKKIGTLTRTAEEASDLAHALHVRKNSMTAAAVTLLLFAVVIGLGAWLLAWWKISLYPVLIAGSAVILALGVLCLVLRRRASSELTELLREWGSEDTERLEEAILENSAEKQEAASLREELQRFNAAYTDALAERRQESLRGRALAARVMPELLETQVEDDDDLLAQTVRDVLVDAIRKAESLCEEREAFRRESDQLGGRLSLLEEQLAGEDETEIRRIFAENMNTVEGRIGSGMDAPRLHAAREELESEKNALHDAESRCHQLETRLAVSRAGNDSPAELRAKIDSLDEEIARLSERHEAYCLAIDTLNQASDHMRASVLPNVIRAAGESVNRISGNAFEAVGVDRGLDMTFTRDHNTHDAAYLSEGTKDIAYISLRRALSTVLFGGRIPPLVYDESFARIDEVRLARILELLSAEGEKGAQSIILSCRKLEAELADGMSAHVICL